MVSLRIASHFPRRLSSSLRRLLVRLRRSWRRPGELEYRRLILAVRSVQQGQIALAERMESLVEERRSGTLAVEPIHEELGVLRTLLTRLEQLGLHQLERVGELAGATSASREAEFARALSELEASLTGEREVQRVATARVSALEEQLRNSDLARAQGEARHSSELAQVLDHARGHIERLEDDLKKKKRGLAALTEENIRLQTSLHKQQDQHAAPPARSARTMDEPPPALPSGKATHVARQEPPEGRGPVTPG